MELKKRTKNTVKESEVAKDPVFTRRTKEQMLADDAARRGLIPSCGEEQNSGLGEAFDYIGNVSHHKVKMDRKVIGKISYGEFVEAIKQCRGLITSVARQLGISVYYVKQVFAKHKTLRQEFDEYREAFLDEVEQSLYAKIQRGDTTAMIFTLKCLGKQRGYVEAVIGSQKKAPVKMKIVPASKKKIEAASKKVAENVVRFKKKEVADG